MAKKKDKEKKGFFGRLFGGKEDASTPGAKDGGDAGDRTIAPGYAGEEIAHSTPNKGGAGHVSFGTGKHKRPQLPEGGDGELTMAPGYVAPDDEMAAAERTMVPGYAEGDDDAPIGGDMRTMAPGYAGGRPPVDPGAPTAKNPAVADPFADFGDMGDNERTMAPGYNAPGGTAASAAPAAADPFADFGDLGDNERTMAPGYNAPGGKAAAAAPAAADPFADFGDLGSGDNMTMAPGYAGSPAGKAAAPKAVDPFSDFGDLGSGDNNLTMAPGYAAPPAGRAPGGKSAPAADPFGDVFGNEGGGPDLTMAPGYAAPAGAKGKAADPFADLEVDAGFDPGLTVAPSYKKGDKRGSPPKPAAADPFAFDLDDPAPAPSGKASSSSSSSDGGPMIADDAFELEPPAPIAAQPVGRPSAAAPAVGGEPFDPFGPALLDDPFAQAPGGAPTGDKTESGLPSTPPRPTAPMSPPRPPVPMKALAAEPQPVDDDGDFRGERTMVELAPDLDMLASLKSTDELEVAAAPAELGAPPPVPAPVAAPPPMAASLGAPPVAAAPRPAARARALFQSARADRGGTRHVGVADEALLDAESGLLFAPRVDGGWTGVPAGFHVLSDGSVIGRGKVHGRDVIVSSPTQGEVHLQLPHGVKVDPQTRAVLWPTALAEQLTWRPRHVLRTEAGLAFSMPAGTRFDDGACVIPADATAAAATSGARDAVHGAVVARHEYLGLVEEVFDDGWSRLTLPAGATLEAGRLVLPAPSPRAGAAPPLLRPERLRDGRLAIDLPAGAQASAGLVWVPPVAAPPSTLGTPWADHDGRVVESREYAGVVEESLHDDWVRLELPEGARVVRSPEGAPRVVIGAEYAKLGDPAVVAELERLPCGSLAFDLPRDAECLGTRVLVPPPGTAPPRSTPEDRPERAAKREAPASSSHKRPTIVENDPQAAEPEPPAASKKMKALDRFRKDKKPQNDSMTFSGVLGNPVEASSTGGAVSEGVPDDELGPRARIEEPVPVAAVVEAAPASMSSEVAVAMAEVAAASAEVSRATSEASASLAAESAATGAFSLSSSESTADAPAAATEPDELDLTASEAEAGEPDEAKGKSKRKKRKGKNGS